MRSCELHEVLDSESPNPRTWRVSTSPCRGLNLPGWHQSCRGVCAYHTMKRVLPGVAQAGSFDSGIHPRVPCREERIELNRGRTAESLPYGDWCSAARASGLIGGCSKLDRRAASVRAGTVRGNGRGVGGTEVGRILRWERIDPSAGGWRSKRDVTFAVDAVMVTPPSRQRDEHRGSARSRASCEDVRPRTADSA